MSAPSSRRGRATRPVGRNHLAGRGDWRLPVEYNAGRLADAAHTHLDARRLTP